MIGVVSCIAVFTMLNSYLRLPAESIKIVAIHRMKRIVATKSICGLVKVEPGVLPTTTINKQSDNSIKPAMFISDNRAITVGFSYDLVLVIALVESLLSTTIDRLC